MARWLLLIHRIPPKPSYFRAKILRRLQGLGAVPIKKSVYALPKNEQTLEDFHWILREIVQGGGEAFLSEGDFVEGLTDEQVRALFHDVRDADYARLSQEARGIVESFASTPTEEKNLTERKAQIVRIRKRLAEIAALDFFGAPGRPEAEELLSALEASLKAAQAAPGGAERAKRAGALGKVQKRTWVTRKGVHVDRIASAWLIRKFIDPRATFRFVSSEKYRPEAEELRFDMFEAEFTHEGDRCTFEVLMQCVGLDDPALHPIAEIVHDIDLKDRKFGRQEAFGVARLIDGITMANRGDEERLVRGFAIFDDLYAFFQNQPLALR